MDSEIGIFLFSINDYRHLIKGSLVFRNSEYILEIFDFDPKSVRSISQFDSSPLKLNSL